jgi:hypothetical protein
VRRTHLHRAVARRSGRAGGLIHLSANDVAHGPRYLRIGRAGDVFTAYVSADNGTSWVPVDGSSVTIHMSTTLLAGMIVASNKADVLNAPSFDDVNIVRQQVSGNIPWHPHHTVRMGEPLGQRGPRGWTPQRHRRRHTHPWSWSRPDGSHTWDSALAASGPRRQPGKAGSAA